MMAESYTGIKFNTKYYLIDIILDIGDLWFSFTIQKEFEFAIGAKLFGRLGVINFEFQFLWLIIFIRFYKEV